MNARKLAALVAAATTIALAAGAALAGAASTQGARASAGTLTVYSGREQEVVDGEGRWGGLCAFRRDRRRCGVCCRWSHGGALPGFVACAGCVNHLRQFQETIRGATGRVRGQRVYLRKVGRQCGPTVRIGSCGQHRTRRRCLE